MWFAILAAWAIVAWMLFAALSVGTPAVVIP
jgi:hypothetical protein